MFDLICGYQGDALINDATMNKILEASERPNSGGGNTYATPRVKRSSNWMSNKELSGEFILLSENNMEREENKHMAKRLKELESTIDKANLTVVEIQNRIGPRTNGRAGSCLQSAYH